MHKLSTRILACLLMLTTPLLANARAAEDAATPHEVEDLVGLARNGNAQAQYKLARAYETGAGTRQSYSEAVRWYIAAANQGFAHAQFSLGLIFEEGRPEVKRDVPYALSWYEEAARNGLTIAVDRLHKLTTARH